MLRSLARDETIVASLRNRGMMRYPWLFLIGTAAPLVAPAQTPLPAASESARVSQTTAWAERVEKEKTRLRRMDVRLPGESGEGNVLRRFTRGDVVLKLEATYYSDSGRSTHHYYVDDGRLRFAVFRESRYDRPRSQHVISQRVEYLWFAGDSLIGWIDTDGVAVTGTGQRAANRAVEVSRDFQEKLALRSRR